MQGEQGSKIGEMEGRLALMIGSLTEDREPRK